MGHHARDCAWLAELFSALLRPPPIPSRRGQARTSEIQRLGKALESAGIKLGSVASSITGTGSTAMIEALIDGERRGGVLADLAIGRMRTAGKLADLSMALAGRFTGHHALLCRLHLDRIAVFDDAVDGLDGRITGKAERWQREAGLLISVPGFGDVVAQAWLGEIGPAPHLHFATHEKLACWVTLCPGNNISARKRKHGRTGDAGTYIKPMLIQAAWAAIRVRAGCRPGTTGWSAGSAARRTRARRRRRSPRSRTPCSRSPTRCSRAGRRTRSRARTSTPGANHPNTSRPGWSASCKSSTPAAPSPSPSARRRPHYYRHLNHKPDSDSPGAAADPAPRPSRRTSQRHSPALATAQARVRCRAPTGDPVIVSAHCKAGSGGRARC